MMEMSAESFFSVFFFNPENEKVWHARKRLAYLRCFYSFYLLVSQLLLETDAIPSTRPFFRLTALYYQLWISAPFNELRIDQQFPILILLYILSISLSFVVLQIPRLLTLIW